MSRHAILLLLLSSLPAATPASAETLDGALIRAYRFNPSLNSGRAGLRGIDESVPQALSALRPKIGVDARLGIEDRRNVADQIDIDNHDPATRKFTESIQSGRGAPRAGVISVEQPLFDGFKTLNATRAAQSAVFAGREKLHILEQRVLFEAVSAYMNVLRDAAALNLQLNNVQVLTEQLRQTRERYLYGQITPTDIAQSEARLAAGKALVGSARAALEASIGNYRRVIGEEPKRLAPAQGVDGILPKEREEAERIALAEHPTIRAALHDADAADLDVHVQESDFMPRLSVVGNIYTQSDIDGPGNRAAGASLIGKLSVPIYEGGKTPSLVRQAKEIAGQKRLDADVARGEVLALTRANWAALQAAKTAVASAKTQSEAAARALYGIREEAKAGQRTTLDILNAQLELLNARIALLAAQRDRVVASYAVLASLGRLSTRTLKLDVEEYDPSLHFDQVQGSWGGPVIPQFR